ncbi:MAG: hypothetical protein QM817_29530 [Archangium sp.]
MVRVVVGVLVVVAVAAGAWLFVGRSASTSEPCVEESKNDDPSKLLQCLLPAGGAFTIDTPKFVASESLPLGEPPVRPGEKIVAARVVSKQSSDGKEFAVIGLELSNSQCKRTRTETWVRQSGAWRRLLIPAVLMSDENDPLAKAKRVQAWRAIDPWSLAAIDVFATEFHERNMRALRLSLFKSAKLSPGFDVEHLTDAARAVNPDDDLVGVLAMVEADDDETLLKTFASIDAKSCTVGFAEELVLTNLSSGKALIDFASSRSDEHAGLVIARALSSDEPAAVLPYLTPAREAAFKAGAQGPRAAEALAQLGLMLVAAGKRSEAQSYLELARKADPASLDAKVLDEVLQGKTTADILKTLCAELTADLCTFAPDPADAATIAMSWLGQRLAGNRELVGTLGLVGRAEVSVRKRMFDEIMSDAAGKPWRCPAFDAMWESKWVAAKECTTR